MLWGLKLIIQKYVVVEWLIASKTNLKMMRESGQYVNSHCVESD